MRNFGNRVRFKYTGIKLQTFRGIGTDIVQEFGFDPLLLDFFKKLIISFLIGILIGIEREYRSQEHAIFAGVRTFAITCITGMLSSFAALSAGPELMYITALFFAAIASIITYSKIFLFQRIGVTSPISLFLTFLLGVFVGYDYCLFAIVCAILLTFLLMGKQPMHQFVENLSREELLNAMQFLVVAFILYPVIPDTKFFGLINLKSGLMIVVLVSLVSFSSYVLLKKFGASKGLSYSGTLGGFVNSEATTGALAGLSKKSEEMADPVLRGLLLCNTAMLVRNLLVAFIVDPSGQTTFLMLPPQFAVILLSILIVLKRGKQFSLTESEGLSIQSPFSLGPAFKFGLAFTLILIVGNTANQVAGTAGIYATSIGALVSSSGVIVSVALLAVNGSISYTTAANTAVLASLISTLNKVLLTKISGSEKLFSLVKIRFVLLAFTGLIALILWSYHLNGL
ncbi:MAG: DUF4010 domain-containing protein [Methanosarcinaceae archaeon]|nr:DUF4010 domain-containing protein [Methanosarcinaceae archaeon]MDD4331206.1 DUF4010 domain-containing protein [Methanosarcinaceae archaeon]MDD4749581.1 DUF4010 domain-containing protein [Methanosarcinaceae archaeon]